MSVDFSIAQGDTAPILEDQLTYEDGRPVNLEGATVSLIMRKMTDSEPVNLTGAVAIVESVAGKVSYTFSAFDTATAGLYEASWEIAFTGGQRMRFPTVGYLSVSIEESLNAKRIPRLVDIEEVRDHIKIPATTRGVDEKLVRLIDACAPLIEHKTGPILPRLFDEWHDGGNTYIMLRRRPATSLGTSPLVRLVACSEYMGPVEWPLKIVASPDRGELYSVQLDAKLARVVRRTAGGAAQPFPLMPQAVHVVYEAGQEEVPMNVRFALCEALREFYQTTMSVGRGRQTVADEEEAPGRSLAYLVARHALGMIEPLKRAPSIA